MKIPFLIWLTVVLFSCKPVKSSQTVISLNREGASNYSIIIKAQEKKDVTHILSVVEETKSPAVLEIMELETGYTKNIMEIRIGYNAITDTTIQILKRKLYQCRGIVEVNIQKEENPFSILKKNKIITVNN